MYSKFTLNNPIKFPLRTTKNYASTKAEKEYQKLPSV